METAFQFVPETHTYLVGGRPIPSVTQILQSTGLVCYDHIPEAILEHKAEIGTAAHAACHYFDEGDLDLNSVHSEVLGYLQAWILFREQTGFVPRLMEQRGIAILNGMPYGYTLDREGEFQERETVFEIKCTAGVEISWGPQMAAYETALRLEDKKARRRVAVHLRKDGTYALLRYSDVWDYRVFEWALGVETWKRQKGKTDGYGANHLPR